MKTKLSRRKLIGLTAAASAITLAGGTMGLTSCTPEPNTVSPADGMDFPAIIIGSGFGGSVAALRLKQNSISTVLKWKSREKLWAIS